MIFRSAGKAAHLKNTPNLDGGNAGSTSTALQIVVYLLRHLAALALFTTFPFKVDASIGGQRPLETRREGSIHT